MVLLLLLLLLLSLLVCAHSFMKMSWCPCGGQRTMLECQLSLYPVGSEHGTHVIKPAPQALPFTEPFRRPTETVCYLCFVFYTVYFSKFQNLRFLCRLLEGDVPGACQASRNREYPQSGRDGWSSTSWRLRNSCGKYLPINYLPHVFSIHPARLPHIH